MNESKEREALFEIWGALQVAAKLQYNCEEGLKSLYEIAQTEVKR